MNVRKCRIVPFMLVLLMLPACQSQISELPEFQITGPLPASGVLEADWSDTLGHDHVLKTKRQAGESEKDWLCRHVAALEQAKHDFKPIDAQ